MSYLPFRNRRGFTLLELVVALAVASAIAVVAVPKMAGVIVKTKITQCGTTRIVIERAEERYRFDNDGKPSSGLEELYGERYIDRVPKCTAGGLYVWISTSNPVKMGCSVHEWPGASSPTVPAEPPAVSTGPVTEPPVTPPAANPLGTTFAEISGGLAKLIRDYQAANGSWPDSTYPSNFTSLGLAPEDWTAPSEHLLYSPSGSLVNISPEAGWEITVTDAKGRPVSLTAENKQELIFNVADDSWYYKSVSSKNKIDIGTMQVTARP